MKSNDANENLHWERQMFFAVSKKRKRGPEISEEKRCEGIEECLYEDVSIDAVDENGDTVLHKAVKEGYLEVVKFLRRKKARIDIFNNRGFTALTLAQELNKTKIIKYLSESGGMTIGYSYARCSYDPVHHAGPSTSAINISDNRGNNLTSITPNQDKKPDTRDKYHDNTGTQRTASNDADATRPSRESSHLLEQEGYFQEGLTKSFHGNMYQLKHYMLILQRASKLGYPFRLAKEMQAADKLDDLVFEYRHQSSGDPIHRFVQFKHRSKQSTNTGRISTGCLYNVHEGDFSLLKYFMSYRKINKRPEFRHSKLKDYILCTNINLDFEELRGQAIDVEQVRDRHDFLKVTAGIRDKEPRCCRLKVKENHDLYNILKRASDVHRLAKLLAEHVREPNKLMLNADILKRYHVSLTTEVIDIARKRFKESFIDPPKCHNLTPKAKTFRDIFLLHAKELPANKNLSDNEIWKKIKDFKFNLSGTFGKGELADLPEDCISDTEISDFFRKFVIAVDQPDETQLTKIISDGLAKTFNLQNADFPVDYFQTAVLDWFKEAGTRGTYLTESHAKHFFDDIQERFSALITIGLSLEYVEELKNYDVKFERVNSELQQFLSFNSASSRVFTLTSSGETLLHALSVYQTIALMKEYEKDDSYILIKLGKLMLPNVFRHVLRAFGSGRCHNLLIIDGTVSSNDLYTSEIWNPLREITDKSSAKRVILINQRHSDSATLDEKYDHISFENLDQNSRSKILRKIVEFQGRAGINWGTLLGIRDFDHIGADELEDVLEITDVDTLVKLIQSRLIKIGDQIEGLDENVAEYYIDRIIFRHGVIDKRIFEVQKLMTDLFAVSSDFTLASQTSQRASHDISLPKLLQQKCIMLDRGNETDHFKNLCEKHPKQNVHLIEYKSGILMLKQSTGGISKLMKYEFDSNVDNEDRVAAAVWLREDELVDNAEGTRIVILSDTAGMGKSTVLTKMAHEIKEKYPSLLVIKVDLSSPQNTRALGEEKQHRTFDVANTKKAVDFLVYRLVRPGSGARVFKRLITQVEGRAVLLFDGFDEISPTYAEPVSDLLVTLAQLKIKKLIVSTRPHTSAALERKLKIRAHTLRPFSEDNQETFLIKFWKKELALDDVNHGTENHLRDHARQVIHVLNESIDDRMREFTGIPLQTKMVAEVYSPVIGERHRILNNRQKLLDFSRLPVKIGIIELYRDVVEKKYNIYFEEKMHGDKSNLGQKSGNNTMRLIFDAAHKKLALDTFFDKVIVKGLLRTQAKIKSYSDLWQQEQDGGERTGIITQVISGSPLFLHRTFAEYFAAVFLFRTLKDNSRNTDLREFFLAKFFSAPEFKTIRAFLNCLLMDESKTSKREPWISDLSEHRRSFGTTVYHIAAAECNTGILRFLLNCLRSYPKNSTSRTITDYIDFRDQNGFTPLHIAVTETADLQLVDCILREGANIDAQNFSGNTPLHEACGHRKVDVTKYLIDSGANIHIKNLLGSTPLYAALMADDMKTATYLIAKGADIQARDAIGRTLLHAANKVNSVKYLVERGASIDTADNTGRTPLYNALTSCNAELAKSLIDNGAKIHTQDIYGKTLLHVATFRGQTWMANFLIDQGARIDTPDKRGKTPLFDAFHFGHTEIARLLIDKGANIHTQDEDGWTLLHAACCSGNMELVKFLLNQGADIHHLAKNGSTLLHKALVNKNFEFAKFLIAKAANIDTPDDNGRTPLCTALRTSLVEIAELLINKGAGIHARDKDGRTPLHATAHAYNAECAKLLIAKSADIHTRDDNGFTLLHMAVCTGNMDLTKYSLQRGIDINIQTDRGQTPLHLAATVPYIEYNFYSNLVFLIEQGANVNSRDENGLTPLHCAVISFCKSFKTLRVSSIRSFPSGNRRAVKFLLKKGADANIRGNDGKTPLDLASSEIDDLDLLQDLFNIEF